jgi:hypothetical protein
MSHDDEISDELERDLLEGIDGATVFLSCGETRFKACVKAYETEMMEKIRKNYASWLHKAWLKSRNVSDPEKAFHEEMDKRLDELLEATRPTALEVYRRRLDFN